MQKYKYLFGPINSRRLGISLGIDLLPYKSCSFDCLYCECGKTDKLSTTRQNFFKTKEILLELDDFLSNNPMLDYITFSGSGEPTLAKNLGKIIKYLKKYHPKYKVAVITNSSLLHLKKVRQSIIKADLLLPSLDAPTQKILQKINRPLPNISLAKILQGLKQLRKNFKKDIYLEIFFIPNLNDDQISLNNFVKLINKIKPNRLQINSLDRMGTKTDLKAIDFDKSLKIKEFFIKRLAKEILVEVILKDKSEIKLEKEARMATKISN